MPQMKRELTIGERHLAFLQLLQSIDATKPIGLRWGTLSQMAKVFDMDMTSNNHTIEDVTHDIGFLKSNITNRGRYDRELLKEDVKRLQLKEG